jgi:hypothetical protein
MVCIDRPRPGGLFLLLLLLAPLCCALPSTLSLRADPQQAAFGITVVFSANVSPADASGLVSFVTNDIDTVTLCTTALAAGAARCASSQLGVGRHSISARYAGDSRYAGSSSSISLDVARAVSTLILSAAPNPISYGGAVMFTGSQLALLTPCRAA